MLLKWADVLFWTKCWVEWTGWWVIPLRLLWLRTRASAVLNVLIEPQHSCRSRWGAAGTSLGCLAILMSGFLNHSDQCKENQQNEISVKWSKIFGNHDQYLLGLGFMIKLGATGSVQKYTQPAYLTNHWPFIDQRSSATILTNDHLPLIKTHNQRQSTQNWSTSEHHFKMINIWWWCHWWWCG